MAEGEEFGAEEELLVLEGKDPLRIGILTVVSLIVALFFRLCCSKIPLPFTFLCLIFGMVVGEIIFHVKLGALGDSIDNWVNISPHTVLFLFLPPLIYESASNMNFHVFMKAIVQIFTLAIPGTLISAILTGLVVNQVFPYGWDFVTCMTLGSVLAATDPVAVVALLQELGAPRSLGTIIEGESLLNDGIAFVLFDFFLRLMEGEELGVVDFALSFAYKGGVGFFSGFLMGKIMNKIQGKVFDDEVAIVMLSLISAYGGFYVGDGVLEASGVLAVVGIGVAYASESQGNISEGCHEAIEYVWEAIGFLANVMVFVFSGIIITVHVFHERIIEPSDYIYMFILYGALNVIRLFGIVVLSPILKVSGYGFNWKQGGLFAYAGLRGAVGLILGLLLIENREVSSRTTIRMMFNIAGPALLTLVINGTTCGMVVQKLGLDRSSAAAKVYYKHVLKRIKGHVESSIQVAKRDEYFKGADWASVWTRMPILSKEMRTQIEQYGGMGPGISKERMVDADEHLKEIDAAFDTSTVQEVRRTLIHDARNRFLQLVQCHYSEEFEEGALEARPSFQILMDAATEGQDDLTKKLHQWSEIKKSISSSCNPLMDNQEQIALGFEAAVVFIKANHHVEHAFVELVGKNEVSQNVLKEVHEELHLAQEYVDDLNSNHPDITCAVKTRWATQFILRDAWEFAGHLQSHGEITEKEYNSILKGFEGCKADLARDKGLCSTKRAIIDSLQVVRNCDLFDKMESQDVDNIVRTFQQKEFMAGEKSETKGKDCSGIFIISCGRVEMSSEIDGEETLLRTLTQGDIIGALEMATSKASKWTTTTKTKVSTYFLKSSDVHQLLKKHRGKQFERNLFCHAGVTILQSCHTLETGSSLDPEKLNTIVNESKLLHPSDGEKLIHDDGIGILFTGRAQQIQVKTQDGRKLGGAEEMQRAVCKFDFNGIWRFYDHAIVLWIPPNVSWLLLPDELMPVMDRDRQSIMYGNTPGNRMSRMSRLQPMNPKSTRGSMYSVSDFSENEYAGISWFNNSRRSNADSIASSSLYSMMSSPAYELA